ncbi:hypothetical protein HOLleu_43331 [Holothuria leucospilota]|uniref:Reverse transcriptase domain-containing protein n=1 Tax=Holothuria leucospilota TaxID=206669 RepID=A0A9Q0Y9L4_HOLLE|nr:hypothetical protein HOLleu_43331 [Holothuria leucospilota]
MATLKRDASVQLRLQNCDGSSSVFKFLKDVGVDPATHLVAVQELPGRYYDVTFKTIEFKRRFWPALCSDSACEVNPYTSSATLVTVLHVPHELDDNTVRYVLGRYGKVISGRFLTFKDYPSIFNGIRHYLIALKSDIPSAIRLGGRDCWVRYGGQPRTCLKCGGKGHDAKDCNQIRCHRCQGLGHVIKDCKMDEFCTVCQKEGHNYRNCPVSFANKIAPTPMKWTFGNTPQNSDEVNDKAVNANKGTEQNSQMDTDSEATQENVSESTETVTESQVAVANDRVTSANKLAEHSSPMDIDQGATHQNSVELTDAVLEIQKAEVKAVDSEAATNRGGASSADVPNNSSSGSKDSTLGTRCPNIERVTRTRKRSSSQSGTTKKKERSRSNIRFPQEDPSDLIKMTQIFLEDEPWHSCVARGCPATFSRFSDLQKHLTEAHPKKEKLSYPCVLKKGCSLSFSTPWDWLQHVALKHPNFVKKQELEFFDQAVHPQTPGHTWFRVNSNQSSRIDRIYVPKEVKVCNSKTFCLPYSDHSPVYVDFVTPNTPDSNGKSYWKYNVSLNRDNDFCRDLRHHYQMWSSLKPWFDSFSDWWENIKGRIRELAIKHSKRRVRKKRESLYSKERNVDHGFQDSFIHSVKSTIDNNQKNKLNLPISSDEIYSALRRTPKNKTPGIDGLPYEFYLDFYDLIGSDLLAVFNDIFIRSTLSPSQQTAIISLIPKNGDILSPCNWRPISLLNGDYKILAKVLQTRLSTAMANIVNEFQACAIPGRTIHSNMILLRDIIDFTELSNGSCCLLSIDQEKAFDKVDWPFLFKVLQKLGFGDNFVRWISILYGNINSRLLINGTLSDPINISRGVRQGCPLSPLLYVLFIEPVASYINSNNMINGFVLPGGNGKRVKFLQYADDATCVTSTVKDISMFVEVFNLFQKATGASINMNKTYAWAKGGASVGARGAMPPPVGEGWPPVGEIFRFRRGAVMYTIKYVVPDNAQSPRRFT